MLSQKRFDLPMLAKKFDKHLSRLNYSLETLRGYQNDLKNLQKYLLTEFEGNILVEELCKDDILDYLRHLEERGMKPNSIARNLATIKSFYKFLVEEMNYPIDVAARIKQGKLFTPLPSLPTDEELQKFFAVAKEYSGFYYTLFCFLYLTGSRLTAARTLCREHVNLVDKKVYFPKVKGGKDLLLPLHDHLCSLLQIHFESCEGHKSQYVFHSPKLLNQPVSAADVRVNMKKIAKIAGITKRLTPHILRHCMATHLTLKGVDHKYLSSILSHSDLRSTARYQHLSVEDLRSSIDMLII